MLTGEHVGSLCHRRMCTQRQLVCLSYNAGGGIPCLESLRAFLISVESSCSQWGVIFLSEVDRFLSHDHESSNCLIDGHLVFRHWPGVGSCPMMFVVHRKLAPLYRQVVWSGRAGGIHLYSNSHIAGSHVNAIIVGLHGGHGDELHTSLMHGSHIIRKLKRGVSFNAQIAVLADWNVDMLPNMYLDPWAHHLHRWTHHYERRVILSDWAEAFGFEFCLPECSIGLPGGAWNSEAIDCPFTRIPLGDQPGLPSCIDYVASSPNFVVSTWCDWTFGFSDHAFLFSELSLKLTFPKRGKRFWNISGESACLEVLGQMPLEPSEGITSVCQKLICIQDSHESDLSCAERSYLRMPFELRLFYRKAETSSCQDDRRMWQLRARTRRRIWIAELKTIARLRTVRQGRVLAKSKKLNSLQGVVTANGRISDLQECSSIISTFFGRKWGGSDYHSLELLKDIFASSDRCTLDLTVDELSSSFGRIHKRLRRGSDGICVGILELLFIAQPQVFCVWFSNVLASFMSMSECTVSASAFGKVSNFSQLEDVRVIMPLPAIMQLADVVISQRLDSFLIECWPRSAMVMECARPRTQVMDIAFAVSMLIEKDLDLGSQGGFAQADVRQHYDTLSMIRIYRWLLRKGCDRALASCALRLQLAPCVFITLGSFSSRVSSRCIGGLTGSRVAGQLGRIPVLESLFKRMDELEHLSWSHDSVCLIAATFVDNTFFVGKSVFKATQMAQIFEETLFQDWAQRVKPSSKQVLGTHGNPDLVPYDDSWTVLESMTVLGHIVQSTGAINLDYDGIVRKMWQSFYANAGAAGNERLPTHAKIKLIERATQPLLSAHAARWPFTRMRARWIDQLQRKMIGSCTRTTAEPDDTAESFMKRRNSGIASVQRRLGKWSGRWATLQTSWHAHLLRERNSWTWGAQLLKIRTPDELEQRRLTLGRVHTRAVSGWCSTRWSESLELAQNNCVT